MSFQSGQSESEPTFMERRLDDINETRRQLTDSGHGMSNDEYFALADDLLTFERDVARFAARNEAGSTTGQSDAVESDGYLARGCADKKRGRFAGILDQFFTF